MAAVEDGVHEDRVVVAGEVVDTFLKLCNDPVYNLGAHNVQEVAQDKAKLHAVLGVLYYLVGRLC